MLQPSDRLPECIPAGLTIRILEFRNLQPPHQGSGSKAGRASRLVDISLAKQSRDGFSFLRPNFAPLPAILCRPVPITGTSPVRFHRFPHNSLACVRDRSDESSCADLPAKRTKTIMKTTEATTTTEAATVAEQGAQGAPEKPTANRAATQKRGTPKGQTAAKGANTKAAPKKEAKAKKAAKPAKRTTAPRAESKGAQIIEMIGRAKGATLAEIVKATDWQAHSVRGFLSTAAKKNRIKIESSKNEGGERVYSIAK